MLKPTGSSTDTTDELMFPFSPVPSPPPQEPTHPVDSTFKHFPVPRFINKDLWEGCINLADYGLSFASDNFKFNLGEKTSKTLLRLIPQVERDRGVTFLTIPEGLSLKILKKIAENPLNGNKVLLGTSWQRIVEVLGDIRVEKTYTVILTNSILSGTRALTKGAQRRIIESFGAEMQGSLEVATLAVLTYIIFKERLFDTVPQWTFSRTKEEIDGENIVAGGFENEIFDVTKDDLGSKLVGAGAMVRLLTDTSE